MIQTDGMQLKYMIPGQIYKHISDILHDKMQDLRCALHARELVYIIHPLPEDYRPFAMLASMATIFFGPPSKLSGFSQIFLLLPLPFTFPPTVSLSPLYNLP